MSNFKERYRKFFNDYDHHFGRVNSLREKVIDPHRYLEVLKDELNRIERQLKATRVLDPLQLFNEIFAKYKIVFISVDDLNHNYSFVKGITKKENIIIYVNEEEFYNYTKKENLATFNYFSKECLLLIGHELVHRGQYYIRVLDQINYYNFDGEDTEGIVDYLKSPQEIMAYAWMYLESLHYAGYNDQMIIDMLKKGDLRKPSTFHINFYLSKMKQLNVKVFNRFLTYIYKYLKDPIVYDLKIEI